MRIYVVKLNGVERLVEASSRAQALLHVARGAITSRVARPLDVARIMGDGGRVEKLNEPQLDIEGEIDAVDAAAREGDVDG